MSNEASLEVQLSVDDNGQNQDSEGTILSRDPGGQVRKARSRQQGGSTAPVRTFFDKRKVNGVQLAFYKVANCSKSVTGYKYGGSTGVLITHMTERHRELWDKHKARQDEGQAKAAKTANSIDRYMRAAPGFWECALRWVVMTNQPLSIVDSPWFERMILAANPKTNMIGRKVSTCVQLIMEMAVFFLRVNLRWSLLFVTTAVYNVINHVAYPYNY